MAHPIRLVASDLDGTLLRPDRSVSPRTRAALDAVRAAGIVVVPVTARQPIGLRLIAEQAGFVDWALCSNAALAVHLSSGEVLFEHTIPVSTQQALATAVAGQWPDVRFASVRDQGQSFLAQHGYPALADYEDHKRHPADMLTADLHEVVSRPSTKVVLRHPEMPVPDLVDRVRALEVPGVELTVSGAPFAEVLPPGVNKAVGLAQLCAHLGIGADEVLAFGDAPNDVEMLQWAGRGVAMGNAEESVRAVADDVTGTNVHDGVAHVLESLLG